MPVTVMDVANKAGITCSNVAPALNNSPAVVRETVERTGPLTREFSCVPIRFARSLKRDRSHRWELTGQPFADLFYGKVQGGFENVAHSLVIDVSFFASARVNKVGKGVTTVVIHHRVSEVLLHSMDHDEIDVIRVDGAFA